MIRISRRKRELVRRRFFELFGSDRYSRLSINGIDDALAETLPANGFFVEAGANDGLSQSNTYWLERFRSWRGLLIEPLPDLAKQCRRNRPRCMVENVALVASSATTSVRMKSLHLMSKVAGYVSAAEEAAWIEAARSVEITPKGDVDVPATTLTALLDRLAVPRVDFLSLDVEGYEMEVLAGIDFTRHAPRFMLIETAVTDKLSAFLADRYDAPRQITYHDYLYSRRGPVLTP